MPKLVCLEFGPDISVECPHAPSPALNTENHRLLCARYSRPYSCSAQQWRRCRKGRCTSATVGFRRSPAAFRSAASLWTVVPVTAGLLNFGLFYGTGATQPASLTFLGSVSGVNSLTSPGLIVNTSGNSITSLGIPGTYPGATTCGFKSRAGARLLALIGLLSESNFLFGLAATSDEPCHQRCSKRWRSWAGNGPWRFHLAAATGTDPTESPAGSRCSAAFLSLPRWLWPAWASRRC